MWIDSSLLCQTLVLKLWMLLNCSLEERVTPMPLEVTFPLVPEFLCLDVSKLLASSVTVLLLNHRHYLTSILK